MANRSKFAVWVVAFTFGLAAHAADQVTFTKRFVVGDKYTFGQNMVNDSNISMTSNGQVLQQVQQNMTQTRAGTATVEAVDANGKPTKTTFVFDNSCGGQMTMAGQSQPSPSGLAGKTVTVTRTGEKDLNYSAEVDPQSAQEIKEMFSQDTNLFPTKPISVGDSWDVDPNDFKKMMPPGGQLDAKGTAKLVSVETVGGRQVATIEMSISMNGNMQGMNMKSDLAGKGTIDVATSQPIDLTFAGPIKASGRQQSPQGAVDIAVDGKMTMNMKNSRGASGGGGGGGAPIGGGGFNPLGGGGGGVNPLGGGGGGALAGTYANDKVTLKLVPAGAGYSGTLRTGGQEYPITATAADGKKLTGKFNVGDNAFDFDAVLEGDTFNLKTGGATYALKRAAPANPLAQ